MKTIGHGYEDFMQEYLSNPNRVSILAPRAYIAPAAEVLKQQELEVDWRLVSIQALESRIEGIKRDKLGVLAIFGAAYNSEFNREDETRLVPRLLGNFGLGDTPTVFIPMNTHSERPQIGIEDAGFTEILDISEFRYYPREIFEQGAALVKRVVELNPLAVE